jgi:hypothetical protein
MPELQHLRIKQIEVKGLFSRYHHTIPLNLTDRVTILHGPNGIGKTVLLRLVNSLLGDPLENMNHIPFDTMAIDFTDGSRLSMTGGERPYIGFFRPGSKKPSAIQRCDPREPNGIPLGLQDIRDQIRCHLIETQRLLLFQSDLDYEQPKAPPQLIYRVEDCARHLEKFIRMIMSLYGRTTQALDQSYPQRVLTQKDRPLPTESLKQCLQDLEAKQSTFIEVGLLDKMTTHPFDPEEFDHLEPTEQLALTLYAHDMADKLSVLDYLARRVKLLLDHLNSKFQTGFRVSVAAQQERRALIPS